MVGMHTVVIDTDPGLDDAIAILLALAYPEACTVRAVTTVAGNQTIEKVTDNALRILSFAGARVPVAAGAAKPLERELVVASRIHGETGLGGVSIPDSALTARRVGAQELLLEVIAGSVDPVTIVSIGPETNIAALLRDHAEAKERIGLISLMGGSLSAGNVTPAAEYNVYADPEAAQLVFSSGLPLVMSGLDVTHRAYLTAEETRHLRERGAASRLVADLVGCYAIRYERAGMPGAAIHDACSVAYLIRPEIFTGVDLHVEVETKGNLTRGMTVADRRPGNTSKPNARVLVDVDRAAFVDLLFDGLARIDRVVTR
jgi:pyrimidine-specific ribonucleoside hydrolase